MPGDANGDGNVDVSDLGILAANYGLTAGAAWSDGDFNADGAVVVGDLGILAANYGITDEAAAGVETSTASGLGCPLVGLILLGGLCFFKIN
jgi:uncharacterized protein (DUF2141 family)